MHVPVVNYLAVLASGVVIFLLGGLWYSPILFAKPWSALMGVTGKTEAELRAGSSASVPVSYLLAFLCGLLSAWVLAVVLNHFEEVTLLRGVLVGLLCWLGFAGPTSYATALFSVTSARLWLINSTYNLVSFVLAGIILAVWR